VVAQIYKASKRTFYNINLNRRPGLNPRCRSRYFNKLYYLACRESSGNTLRRNVVPQDEIISLSLLQLFSLVLPVSPLRWTQPLCRLVAIIERPDTGRKTGFDILPS